MEDLFRFLLVRPADAVEEKKVAVTLEKRTPFQADLANALSVDLPLAMSASLKRTKNILVPSINWHFMPRCQNLGNESKTMA